jgi:hypothetical protein
MIVLGIITVYAIKEGMENLATAATVGIIGVSTKLIESEEKGE